MLRLEQTETALSLLRSDDALELAVLAGMPTSAQQERARVLAAIALNESTTLTREVEERLYQLGEQLRLNPDEATRLERMRSAALLESDRLVIRRAMAVASRIAVNQLDREERARLADGAIAELSVFLDHPSFGTTGHLLTARMQMATGRSTDAATRYEALANEPDGALGSLDRAEAVLGVASRTSRQDGRVGPRSGSIGTPTSRRSASTATTRRCSRSWSPTCDFASTWPGPETLRTPAAEKHCRPSHTTGTSSCSSSPSATVSTSGP
jgi:hypothetical protein